MYRLIEKFLLRQCVRAASSEADLPVRPEPQDPSVDDIPLPELLKQADRIARMIAKRGNLSANDEKAILAAAFLAMRRRADNNSSGSPSGTPRSMLMLV